MISIDRTICNDLQEAKKREWLETNGLGGFASSTLAGINTRRYHGLLMAATQPPTGRMLLLSKLEETLVLGDRPMVVRLHQQAFRGDPGKWTGEKAFVRSRQHQ